MLISRKLNFAIIIFFFLASQLINECVMAQNIISEDVEKNFPCWYEIINQPEQCVSDSVVVKLNNELQKMDSIIQFISSRILKEKRFSNLGKFKQSILDWQKNREYFVKAYSICNSDGTLRGIMELEFKRDYTKFYLLSLISIDTGT